MTSRCAGGAAGPARRKQSQQQSKNGQAVTEVYRACSSQLTSAIAKQSCKMHRLCRWSKSCTHLLVHCCCLVKASRVQQHPTQALPQWLVHPAVSTYGALSLLVKQHVFWCQQQLVAKAEHAVLQCQPGTGTKTRGGQNGRQHKSAATPLACPNLPVYYPLTVAAPCSLSCPPRQLLHSEHPQPPQCYYAATTPCTPSSGPGLSTDAGLQ